MEHRTDSVLPLAGRCLCFVSHTADLGGAERTLVELARGFGDVGAEVHVILPAAGKLDAAMREVGARTRRVEYGRWTTRRGSFRYRARRWKLNLLGVPRIHRALREIRPDVVMTNTMTVPSAAFAARWLRLPHVWFVQEFGREDHGLRFDVGYAMTLRAIDRLSDAIIVPSRANREALTKYIPRDKMAAFYYAPPLEVNLSRRIEPGSTPLRAVIVGAVKESKGQLDAIEAVGELARRGRHVRLSIVGEGKGSYVAGLEDRVRVLGVADRVELTGFTDPQPYLRDSHVALMCSRQESFGKVTVEAMMNGCAVVGARSGGTAELIVEGETGYLYEPGDSSDLADQIERLDCDRALCQKIGQASHEWAFETFRLEDFIERVWAVMSEAIRSSAE